MKHLYIVILFFLFHVNIYGQRYHMNETTKPNDKLRYLKHDMSLVNGIVFCDYGDWGLYKDGKPTGLHKRWYKKGTIQTEVNLKDGKLDGLCRKWYQWNGQLKEERNYKDGEVVSQKCWDENGNQIDCK